MNFVSISISFLIGLIFQSKGKDSLFQNLFYFYFTKVCFIFVMNINLIKMARDKKVVSYYLKTENDDFLKKHAEHIGRSKNYILDILIQNLRKDVAAKRDNKDGDTGI